MSTEFGLSAIERIAVNAHDIERADQPSIATSSG